MLQRLLIQNIVLIEKLELTFDAGLVVLTGETGSGKSIVLDALGLVLGGRGETRLVRQGAEQALVSAEFDIQGNTRCQEVLEELGLPVESPLTIRRTLTAEGKGRVLVADMPVSVTALRQIGDTLLEIQGQHEQRGLLDVRSHRDILDAYGNLRPQVKAVTSAYEGLRKAQEALEETQAALVAAQREEEYLRHVVAELQKLAPQSGEEEELSETRRRMMLGEKQAKQWQESLEALEEPVALTSQLEAVSRGLLRAAGPELGPVQPISEALNHAVEQVAIAVQGLEHLIRESTYDASALENAEERLFALRAAARKHHCTVEELVVKYQQYSEQLANLDHQSQVLDGLHQEVAQAKQRYETAARALSAARVKTAASLTERIQKELPPLKLENARFSIALKPLEVPSSTGKEAVEFIVATNPGSAPGPLAKIASGGELSRLMLACKVVLADVEGVPSMVFDEVDTGISGAVADAVGKRLAALAKQRQLFVVTHQPQVAAFARQHLRVSKAVVKGTTRTTVEMLTSEERHEEVARMLAGAEVTEHARAAAASLLKEAV